MNNPAMQAAPRWTHVHADCGYGPTTRSEPDMAWYWRAGIYYGHCATEAEAIAAINEKLPLVAEIKAKEAARKAEFAALPEHLQKLKIELDEAEFERQRIWGRTPFEEAEYRLASELYWAAYRSFHVAHDQWLCQREARAA